MVNKDRYEKDLTDLIDQGQRLLRALGKEFFPEDYTSAVEGPLGEGSAEHTRKLPSFIVEYQPWYSEAKVLVRQLLPDRLSDFTRNYEKPTSRKGITHENYTIEDYLHRITVTRDSTTVVGPISALTRFQQQLSIVMSIRGRFRSSLFDIRQMAQADLFDSELEAARELAKHKFNRAAGVVAGVVLERHLKEVCASYKVIMRKKAPQISDLNDALKKATVIDTPQWRSIQYLGDIRNLCAHDRQSEPTADQVGDLLDGATNVTKTIF